MTSASQPDAMRRKTFQTAGALALATLTGPGYAQTAAAAAERRAGPLGARLQGVQHFGVTVDRMDRAFAFYTEVLGGTEVMRDGDFQGERIQNTLLADEDHAVCEAYGVWAEKAMYGKTYWGALRATFIIDATGTIAHVIPKASPKTHDDEVLKALKAL